MSSVSAACSFVNGVSGYSPSRNFVSPTGTIDTLCTPGYSASRSRIERISSSPSLRPGQQTIWQFIVMPDSAKRRMVFIVSPARGLRSMAQRSSGFVVWTETFIGLICSAMMRSISRFERFVSVM